MLIRASEPASWHRLEIHWFDRRLGTRTKQGARDIAECLGPWGEEFAYVENVQAAKFGSHASGLQVALKGL
ncbi:MAG: hypothetical protein A2Z18_11185 [Armatimonadetes bacterium RBG_16_58_9]|nr:MAG: hypothetical protein A2Z18_11185 [Armatimonadetes bacterium RBG_16_58_9]